MQLKRHKCGESMNTAIMVFIYRFFSIIMSLMTPSPFSTEKRHWKYKISNHCAKEHQLSGSIQLRKIIVRIWWVCKSTIFQQSTVKLDKYQPSYRPLLPPLHSCFVCVIAIQGSWNPSQFSHLWVKKARHENSITWKWKSILPRCNSITFQVCSSTKRIWFVSIHMSTFMCEKAIREMSCFILHHFLSICLQPCSLFLMLISLRLKTSCYEV